MPAIITCDIHLFHHLKNQQFWKLLQ